MAAHKLATLAALLAALACLAPLTAAQTPIVRPRDKLSPDQRSVQCAVCSDKSCKSQLSQQHGLLLASWGMEHAAPEVFQSTLTRLYAAQPITKVPLDMQVNITGYLLNGVSVPFNGPPCTGTCSTNPSMCIEFGTPCLQKVQNGEEGVTFSYDFNSTAGIAPVSVNAYICYSTWSQIGRPWRVTSGAKNILVRLGLAHNSHTWAA